MPRGKPAPSGAFQRTKRKFKQEEFERLDGRCPHCDVEMTWAKNQPNTCTFDHTVSPLHGGEHAIDNGTVMCARCNMLKGCRPMDEFLRIKPWLMPIEVFSLYKTQVYAARSGNLGCLKAMDKFFPTCMGAILSLDAPEDSSHHTLMLMEPLHAKPNHLLGGDHRDLGDRCDGGC